MHVHFTAIAGTGMGALAALLKSRGHRVTGSDAGVYPPMSDFLEAQGIAVQVGFCAERLRELAPDLVVIGNSVRADNPEARAARDAGLRTASFADALYEHAMRGHHRVVVAGTHGKTTTTSMTAVLLHEAGRDPSMLVGGVSENFGGGFLGGAGEEFVVEGDEYDTAFFDKTPKFMHYHPHTLVLTSVEFDHADIYRDLEHVGQAFRALVQSMPKDGAIIAAHAGPALEEVVRAAPCPVLRYGVEREAQWCARGLRAAPEGTHFTVHAPSVEPCPALLPAYGKANVANALAALAVAVLRGVPLPEAARALLAWRGVRRRQELRGEAAGIALVDDFAHHPTAVRETLPALRARFPGRRLVAVFEPRSNTSRRALFQDAYVSALGLADRVLVQCVPDAPIYSAFGEDDGVRLDAERLARELCEAGTPAEALPDVAAIVERLAGLCRPGDVVVTLSNGGFGGIWDALLARLTHQQALLPPVSC